ncbi:hypothetical protein SeLEV6574_g08614 [Synchytrium endobioticum]|uniref:NADH dehydrogenase [ubiquinone] 1 beta subcomplex subunit 7 n=1 Tax=Synchytrium endobioticum TaxID=286115 RepID=A0A507BHQ7_9FUNG|nr:hypothetical protein SeLEV6574_g08614 [Synchytrium endobioticum]
MTAADHHHGEAPTQPKMLMSQEDLAKHRIPIAWRDYCAHLLPDLYKCRHDHYYLPWACEKQRVAWTKCQYDDYQRRMRLMQKQRQDAAAASLEESH